MSPVGFAEIRLRNDTAGSRDVRVSEIVKMPTDLLSTVGHRVGRTSARVC